MAKLSIVLDTRKVKVGGLFPLKIGVSHNHSTSYISLGINLAKENWDGENYIVKGRPDRMQLNARIAETYCRYEEILLNAPAKGMTSASLRDYLLDPRTKTYFLPRYQSYMERCSTEGTRQMYRMCLRCMEKFDPGLAARTFEDIDRAWIVRFDAFLSKTMCANTRSMRMRSIRAVFNDAIADGITAAYPFRNFRIKQEETRKRSLSVEQLRELRDWPCADWQTEYRDMFMLMVYLGGINAADLFQAEWKDIVNGRLEYRRQKTHRLYSVKIEPEAWEIISRYRGKRYILSGGERCTDYRTFLQHMNRALKEIGRKEGKFGRVESPGAFPELSTYWARHTVATIAASIDVPLDTISLILGHSFGCSTTQIYVRHDLGKVDRAMREVLDVIGSPDSGRTPEPACSEQA